MPEKNRDTETLYRKGVLSKWFAVSCLVLVVCVGLMFWQDYARPWKRYQRTWHEKQVEVGRDLAEQARLRLNDDEVKAAEAVLDEARRARRAQEPRIRELEERIAELSREERSEDASMKTAKAKLVEARYHLEVAQEAVRHEGSDAASRYEERKDEVNRWAGQLDASEIRLSNVQSDIRALQAELDAIHEPVAKAEKDVARALARHRTAEKAAEGLERKYEKNRWRDLPVIDFISPATRIEQVVLPDIHDNWNFDTNKKVDRCMTCHLGIDLPDFANPELVAKHGLEGWMQAHPGLDLIGGSNSPHSKDRTGCTVCHAGVGWSTDFSRAAHTPRTPEQQARWEEDHDWHPPEFVDYPMLPPEYVQGQCFKCHKEGMYVPPVYLERLDHGWTWRRDPKTGRILTPQVGPDGLPLSPLQAWGDYKLPPAPKPVAGAPSEVAAGIEAFLRSEEGGEMDGAPWPGWVEESRADEVKTRYDALHPDYKVHSHGWDPKRYDRGYDAIVGYGCQGCHKIQDFGQVPGYEAPPRVAPDLRYLADKLQTAFIDRWIRAPETFRIDTPMPSFFYFVPKDADWNPIPGPDGKRQLVAVADAHLTDPVMAKRLPEAISTARDRAQWDVEILAMTTYLGSQSGDRAREKHALYREEPPPGDVERGRKTLSTMGCAGCHVLPEIESGGQWGPDDGARFGGEVLLPNGTMRAPRLTGLGSKLLPGPKGRIWLNAWLADPRHYSADTRMPDMRWRDETDESGRVVRTAAQVRADVVDYLLSGKDAAFEEIPETKLSTDVHLEVLRDMYEEFFGKAGGGSFVRKAEIEGRLADLQDATRLATILRDVGERLMSNRGCFGCHAVGHGDDPAHNHVNDQPIGTELTREGVKDLHQLDFGKLAHGTDHDVVPHTRYGFIRTKVTWPRVYDFGRVSRWTDRLRMPRFNFRMDDAAEVSTRSAVTGIVLGLVDEPIKDRALFHPDEFERDVIAGRRVAKRFGCNNCHNLEGREGILWGLLTKEDEGQIPFAPPNLFGEGLRVQPSWLMKFVQHPFDLRPQVVPRMPRFGLNDEQAAALARYFLRLGGDRVGQRYQPDSRIPKAPFQEPVRIALADRSEKTVRSYLGEVELLFETINCNKCHLPKGSPGADPKDGGIAPSFEHASARLQRDWVRMLLNDPAHLIDRTKMTQFWTLEGDGSRTVVDAYRPFLLDLRHDADWLARWNGTDPEKKSQAQRELAERQMDWISDFVVHHYRPPAPPAEAPR